MSEDSRSRAACARHRLQQSSQSSNRSWETSLWRPGLVFADVVMGQCFREALGQSLESDDWRDPDCLMNFYWQA